MSETEPCGFTETFPGDALFGGLTFVCTLPKGHEGHHEDERLFPPKDDE